MASAHMPDEFFETVAHHLPPEQPVGPKGGRPRVGHRVVIRVIWFVLTTGARWEDVPAELGSSGRTAHRWLRAWEEAGLWDPLHADLLAALSRPSVHQAQHRAPAIRARRRDVGDVPGRQGGGVPPSR